VSSPSAAGTVRSEPGQIEYSEPIGTLVGAPTARRGPHERRRRPWLDPVLLVPALVTLAICAWDLGTPSYWRDEAATLDAEARSVPALLRMLTHVDAVHGAYYLLMWPVVHTFGTAEVVLRLPSLLAMTGAAAGVAALGRRLHSPRAGLLAGLVFAVLPQVSRYAQEGRSYAFVLACAVLASYLLVRAADEPGRRRLPGYGCAVAALGLLNLFGLLLLVGHAVFLLAGHRTLLRRWLAVAAAACLPALPVVVLAWRQRDQLGWLTEPDAGAPGGLIVWLAGSTGSVVLMSVLIGFGLRSRAGAATAWLALPWLVAPPVLLLTAAEVAMPVYVQRYVAYCLPALALPVGVGLAGIAVAPRVLALLLVAGLGAPTQLAQRQIDGHGDEIRVAADILAARERPGDGVLYDCPTCHYPDMPREFAFAYPAAFGPLDDLALARSPGVSGTLRGTDTDQVTLRRRLAGVRRVWLIETGGADVPVALADSGLHRAAVYPAGDITVALYER
jgi:mannosyltransferase